MTPNSFGTCLAKAYITALLRIPDNQFAEMTHVTHRTADGLISQYKHIGWYESSLAEILWSSFVYHEQICLKLYAYYVNESVQKAPLKTHF